MVRRWIQEVGLKKGSLSRQLGIREEDSIPFGLLEDILKADVGEKVHNDFEVGDKVIRVTPLLKKRANLALNLKRISKKR